MTLLDTNVISAVMSPSPPPKVLDWLNLSESATLFLSSVTLAEIGYGLAVLADGRKKRDLENRFETFVATAFEDRILDFDRAAARLYGGILAHRRALGRPMSMADGQIAAIARSRQLVVATRNLRDFEDCGLRLVNPFEPS